MKLKKEDVEWVVNDMAELGVKIGDQFFFLYKGRSLDYATDEDEWSIKWRYVGKREFGECCHPWYAIKKVSGEERLPETYVGFHGEKETEWEAIPTGSQPAEKK